ncbi:MAG: NUDIX domain-containing protein [Patescibacteria group bacterium]
MKKRQYTKKQKVKFEISAGGIVFRKTRSEFQIAFLLDPYKKWTFAKGHPKSRRESLKDAALRETQEEMGLRSLKVIEKLGKIDLWFWQNLRERKVLIHKPVYYFLMQTKASASGMSPQKSEKIFKTKWVDIEKAIGFSSYKNVRPLIKKAILKIKKLN